MNRNGISDAYRIEDAKLKAVDIALSDDHTQAALLNQFVESIVRSCDGREMIQAAYIHEKLTKQTREFLRDLCAEDGE